MRETGNHLWGDGVGWSKKHLVYPVGCGWLGPCSPSKVVLPPSTVLVGASLDMFCANLFSVVGIDLTYVWL